MLAHGKVAVTNIVLCVLATITFHIALLQQFVAAQKKFESNVHEIMSTPRSDYQGIGELLNSQGIVVMYTGTRDAFGKSSDDYVVLANEFIGKPHLDLIFRLRSWVTCAAGVFILINIVLLVRTQPGKLSA